ncbi:MAG: leucine-rich repeat domain-containing protein [Treponema sp.]|jgi:hypothetical protein|nr:leucine-rich repeat domain-containing protein [Treponema sp.]
MRKLLFCIIAMSICANLFGQWHDDFKWQSDNQSGAIIIDYIGSSRTVAIPETIDGIPVFSIGDSAFQDKQLTAIYIPDSVISIGNASFMENKLTSVTIPDSIISIGHDAFRNNCLNKIIISNNVTRIGYDAFRGNQLTSISIPKGITTIESGVFAENQLNKIFIPNGVVSIEELAFTDNCLREIFIPESIRNIKSGAFNNNSLIYVKIGANVSLENDVFGTDYHFNEAYFNTGRLSGGYVIGKENTAWQRTQHAEGGVGSLPDL